MSDEVNFENVDALPDVENNAEAAAVTEEPQEAPVEATEEAEAPVEEAVPSVTFKFAFVVITISQTQAKQA